jgi:hypothetical protein
VPFPTGQQTQTPVQKILADPEFKNFDRETQRKILSDADSEFAGMQANDQNEILSSADAMKDLFPAHLTSMLDRKPDEGPIMGGFKGVLRSAKGLLTSPFDIAGMLLAPPDASKGEAAVPDMVPGAQVGANIVQRMFVQPYQQMQAAKEAAIAKGLPQTAQRLDIESKIPLLGPFIEKGVSRYASGDKTGALTETFTDATAPYAANKATKYLKGLVAPIEDSAAIADTRIPLTLGQATGNPKSLAAQKYLAGTNADVQAFEANQQGILQNALKKNFASMPGAADPLLEGQAAKFAAEVPFNKELAAQEKNLAALQNQVNTTQQSISSVPDSLGNFGTPEAFGIKVRNMATGRLKGDLTAYQSELGELKPALSKVQIDTAPLNNVAKRVVAAYEDAGIPVPQRLRNLATVGKEAETAASGLLGPDGQPVSSAGKAASQMSLDELIDQRSYLLERVRALKGSKQIGNKETGNIQNLLKTEIEPAIEKGFSQAGLDVEQWRNLNAKYRGIRQMQDDSVLSGVLDGSLPAEKISQMLPKLSAEDVRFLKQKLGPEAVDGMLSDYLRRNINTSTKGASQAVLNPTGLKTRIGKLGPDVLRELTTDADGNVRQNVVDMFRGLSDKITNLDTLQTNFKTLQGQTTKAKFQQILNSAPEDVHKLIPQMSVAELRDFRGVAPKSITDAMLKNVLSDAIDTSIGGDAPRADWLRARLGQSNQMNPTTIRQALTSIGRDKLNALVEGNPENAKALNNIYEIADAVDALKKGGALNAKMGTLMDSFGYHAPMPARIPGASKIVAYFATNPQKAVAFKKFLLSAPTSLAEKAAIGNLVHQDAQFSVYDPASGQLVY